jgi:hypothetical protein
VETRARSAIQIWFFSQLQGTKESWTSRERPIAESCERWLPACIPRFISLTTHKVVYVLFDSCPADTGEVADEEFLGRLTPAESAAFEQHCMICATCAALRAETRLFIRAIKAAARAGRLLERGQPAQPVLSGDR